MIGRFRNREKGFPTPVLEENLPPVEFGSNGSIQPDVVVWF
jgi:hypothetical protein